MAWPFLVAAAAELWLAAVTPWWIAWFFAWCGASTAWAAAAWFAGRPAWLGKGRAAAWLLAPFLGVARAAAHVGRRLVRAPRVQVVEGLWVGGWPHRGAPEFAQLDLCAELPRRGTALRYACVPMLDGAVPSREAYATALATVHAWRAEGLPVLVHCAYGHGRSVAVVIGVLVEEGRARDWREAHAMVLRLRPLARMTRDQRKMLESLALAGP